MSESIIMKQIQIAYSKLGGRLFRNNVAQAWTGKVSIIKSRCSVALESGDVVIRHARPLHAGLCVGSSDLIGWTPQTITAEMVGKTLAVFTAVETKTAKGKLSEEQQAFLNVVQKSGGIGIIARSVEDIK